MGRLFAALLACLALGCDTSSTPSGGDGDGAVGPDLSEVCTSWCGAVRRQCRGAATCEAECACREPRASCRDELAAYLDCASRTVLSCPEGEPLVLCSDQRQAYDACRTSTPAPDGGVTCSAPMDAGANDGAVVPADVPTDADPPNLGRGLPGDPCRTAAHCFTGGYCYPESMGYPGGECIKSCTNPVLDCPTGSVCVGRDFTGKGVCLASCITNSDCRDGYHCSPDRDGTRYCRVRCTATPGWCGAYQCDPSTYLCATRCGSGGGCSAGSTCGLSSTDCECSSATNCGAHRRCSASTGRCECADDAACPIGTHCSASGGGCS